MFEFLLLADGLMGECGAVVAGLLTPVFWVGTNPHPHVAQANIYICAKCDGGVVVVSLVLSWPSHFCAAVIVAAPPDASCFAACAVANNKTTAASSRLYDT